MKQNSSQTTNYHPEPSRTNHKEAPKSEEASKEMHRQRKECTSEKLRPAKFCREIGNIFEKSKTNSHKWTHHCWVRIDQRLEPLPYFFIKRCLQCLWKEAKNYFIVDSSIEETIDRDCYPERYEWEIFPTCPDIWETSEEKKYRNQNPLKTR